MSKTAAAPGKHVVAEFSLTPLGVGESVSGPVAKATRIVRASGLRSLLTPMGTVVEGPWDDVMALIERCVDEVTKEAPRVSVLVKLDYRKSAKPGSLEKKVRAVEEKL